MCYRVPPPQYDAVHNSHMGLTRLHDVYGLSKVLANAVVPNEYGITDKQKLSIGSKASEMAHIRSKSC